MSMIFGAARRPSRRPGGPRINASAENRTRRHGRMPVITVLVAAVSACRSTSAPDYPTVSGKIQTRLARGFLRKKRRKRGLRKRGAFSFKQPSGAARTLLEIAQKRPDVIRALHSA